MIIADLHIHSKYSRATSTNLDLNNLEKWARVKGLNLLGTGDFTHPKWIKELKENLKEENGILKTKTGFNFILQTEISLMYSQDGKGRRVHLIVLAPSFEVVDQITEYLKKKGRVDYDGRPIFNISCADFVADLIQISKEIEIIPPHCMTPWFGVFGSATGFDSLKECFKEQEKNIHAIETGMSADPKMLWQLSFLNNKTIMSSSDSHSFWPFRLGRESTIFSGIKCYKDLIKQVRENKILGTIETDPAYGKYHYDGHRVCSFSCSPKESKRLNNVCPICKKPLTIGVENRIEELTDQNIEKNPNRKHFYKILPLSEVIAVVLGKGIATRAVWTEYNKLIDEFKNEFNILLNVSEEELKRVINEKLAKLIMINREGKIKVDPGYDGVYGKLILEENSKIVSQKTLASY